MEIWAISDIHGYHDKFRDLLEKIGFITRQGKSVGYHSYSDKKLVLLGDYIDRGPEPLKVLYDAWHLQKVGAKVLLGNHDYWLLRKLKGNDVDMSNPERAATWEKLMQSTHFMREKDDWLAFLESLPYFYEEGDFKFVHAYYSATAAKKDKKAQRVKLYGPTGEKRVLENGFPDRIPWYETYDGRKGKIIFGHYSMKDEVSEFPHAVSVDCGVFKTGVLGAYEVYSGRKVYV